MDLTEGARNLVVAYACVKKGENVCIYADTSSDPQVIEAIAVAAREAGGEVVITISDEADDPEESGLIDPSKIVRNAFYASDVILSIVSIFKMQFSTPATARALNEYGARLAYIGPNTSEELASEWARFPAELSFAIAQKTRTNLQAGSDDVTLTDESGTHLKVKVEPKNWGGAGVRGPLNKPGQHAVLPASTVGTNRIKEVNGNIFPDFLEIFGPTGEICEWVIKDNWVTDIRGGPQAEAFKERIFKIKNANLFSQISWGFNPKIKINKSLQPHFDKNKLGMITRAAGVMHLGLGSTLFHQKGKKEFASPIHTHGILLKPTLTAGNKMIIEKGNLTVLNDPEIRDIAKKYGDPDVILTQLS
jgi:leucyl aminopeptidase (aminopeptidase T)